MIGSVDSFGRSGFSGLSAYHKRGEEGRSRCDLSGLFQAHMRISEPIQKALLRGEVFMVNEKRDQG